MLLKQNPTVGCTHSHPGSPRGNETSSPDCDFTCSRVKDGVSVHVLGRAHCTFLVYKADCERARRCEYADDS